MVLQSPSTSFTNQPLIHKIGHKLSSWWICHTCVLHISPPLPQIETKALSAPTYSTGSPLHMCITSSGEAIPAEEDDLGEAYTEGEAITTTERHKEDTYINDAMRVKQSSQM